MTHTPLETAIALSLYAYNVPYDERAELLYHHFGGDCAELGDLMRHLSSDCSAFAATMMAMPTTAIYVQHALCRYGEEARERVRCERAATRHDFPDDVAGPDPDQQIGETLDEIFEPPKQELNPDLVKRLDDAIAGAVSLTKKSREILVTLSAWARCTPAEALEEVLEGALIRHEQKKRKVEMVERVQRQFRDLPPGEEVTDPEEFERRAREALKPLERLATGMAMENLNAATDDEIKESLEALGGEAGDDGQSQALLTLRRSSWENIFRVLKWCAPMQLSVSMDSYAHANPGEHWSLGNFWACVQELQRQFAARTGDHATDVVTELDELCMKAGVVEGGHWKDLVGAVRKLLEER